MKTHIEIIVPFSSFDVHSVSLIWHIFSLTSTVNKTAESSIKSVIFCLKTSSTSWWLQEDGTQSAQWISDVLGITWLGCGSKKIRNNFILLKNLFYVFKLAFCKVQVTSNVSANSSNSERKLGLKPSHVRDNIGP